MNVWMCVYVPAYMCMGCIYVCVYVCLYVCMFVCVCASVCIGIYLYNVIVCMYVRTRDCLRLRAL